MTTNTLPPASTLPPTGRSTLPPAGQSALRAGVVGNFVDNLHMFLPLTALAPAIAALAGPGASVMTGPAVVIAMMLGRPLGALVFGRISDRLGRTRATRVAIIGTACCALLIAVIPTYRRIGALAVSAVLLARFLGGIFIAGEYSAAIPLAMEWSPPRRRGWMSGFILSMAPWAQGTIAFATAGLLTLMGTDAYVRYGWRLLFLIGMVCSLGMLTYYTLHVSDSPAFHRRSCRASRTGLSALLTGRHAPIFWRAFTLMTGLWLMTDVTVLILPARLVTDTGLAQSQSAFVMGVASVAQALFMALAGHLSSLTGRRRLLVGWAVLAAIASPVLWLVLVRPQQVGTAACLAAALQVVSVAAYGPIAAYLSELFPTEVRSRGYGAAYSFSLVLPALYPFYLGSLESAVGHQGAPLLLLVLAALLVTVGAGRGPRLSREDWDCDIDDVAAAGCAPSRVSGGTEVCGAAAHAAKPGTPTSSTEMMR